MSIIRGLLLAASVAIAGPANAQAAPAPSSAQDAKVVEGATPDRVAQIDSCQGQKFESSVEIDPVQKRSTRVKLCANPGSSDADWVRTLEAAVAQIEQRDMPRAAKDKLIVELQSEIAKFKVASRSATVAPGVPVLLGREAPSLTAPAERYETSILPSLTQKVAVKGGAAVAAAPQRPMRILLKCLERRQSGPGASCDYIEGDTILVVSAVEGLEEGATLRFWRRSDARGLVLLAPMRPGQSIRAKLPSQLCDGVSSSKVEIELVGPKSTGVAAARMGPFRLRC